MHWDKTTSSGFLPPCRRVDLLPNGDPPGDPPVGANPARVQDESSIAIVLSVSQLSSFCLVLEILPPPSTEGKQAALIWVSCRGRLSD